MNKIICEKGQKCIFLDVQVERYAIPIFKYSEKMHTGEQLVYYCKHPKKAKFWNNVKLTRKEKYSDCGYKTTNQLEEFINV